MCIKTRLDAIDWDRAAGLLDLQGWVTTGPVLTDEERRSLIACYEQDGLFRSTINMARHGFGQGEYRYFSYPLPMIVHELRAMLYDRLVAVANRWRDTLGLPGSYPSRFADFIVRCHQAGQTRPTPLVLRYSAGDHNCLHQDLYGELSFPLQAVFLLSESGKDFAGGELVLTEQRPRRQSKAVVVPLAAGEAAIFAVNHRPARGARGTYRVAMRHGVSPVLGGKRHSLGVIFHDAS